MGTISTFPALYHQKWILREDGTPGRILAAQSLHTLIKSDILNWTAKKKELEKIMSEINLFNRWKVKKPIFWGVVAGVPALCIVVFLIVLFVAPLGGASYKSVYPLSAPDSGYGGGDFYAGEGAVEYEAAQDQAYAPGASVPSVDLDKAFASNSEAIPTARLIIREGNIQVQVEDTRQARDNIESLVATMLDKGAFVVSSTENSRGVDLSPNISMVIRVPVDEFESVMAKIADMAVDVTYSNEWSEDVTEEYVDVSSRIEAMEAARDRLLTIMEEADTTEDLLQAEAQLTIRESEIESLKARRNFLSESAKLSRITITLDPYVLHEPIETKWNPSQTVRNAIESLIQGIHDFADFLIYFGIAALPWLVFFGLIIWGIVAFIRKRRAKKAEAQKK
jgi:hypothetical protein